MIKKTIKRTTPKSRTVKTVKRTATKSRTTKTTKRSASKSNSSTMIKGLGKARVESTDLTTYAKSRFIQYGNMTIHDRAIPDYRDGLKPVHRRILWQMYEMGLHHNSAYRKSAKVMGAVIGNYNPHGELAAYEAGVTLANSCVPLVDGEGNWGGMEDSAAADRYTECRLSKYSDLAMLSPYYLKAVDMADNYDATLKEPSVLPSVLPTLLLNGTDGIAVAITTHVPAFKAKGLIALVKKGLTGSEITPRDCLKHLEFNSPYGGHVIASESELLDFFSNKSGKILWECDYRVDKGRRSVIIEGVAPGWSIPTRVGKLSDLPYLQNVLSQSRSHSARIVLRFKRCNDETFASRVSEVVKLLQVSQNYYLNVTESYVEQQDNSSVVSAKFRSVTIPELITEWCQWRVGIESKALKIKESELLADIDRQMLLLNAVKHLDEIFTILKGRGRTDKVVRLSRLLKISEEESKYIWSIAVGRLDRLSVKETQDAIKRLKGLVADNRKKQKHPEDMALASLKNMEGILA